jgi:hypothetical protein
MTPPGGTNARHCTTPAPPAPLAPRAPLLLESTCGLRFPAGLARLDEQIAAAWTRACAQPAWIHGELAGWIGLAPQDGRADTEQNS